MGIEPLFACKETCGTAGIITLRVWFDNDDVMDNVVDDEMGAVIDDMMDEQLMQGASWADSSMVIHLPEHGNDLTGIVTND